MAVEIYFWPPALPLTIGHAAIVVDGGSPPGRVYLSPWPGHLIANLVGPAAYLEYSQHVAAEDNLKPEVVRLTKLDETAIKEQIQKPRVPVSTASPASTARHRRRCAWMPGFLQVAAARHGASGRPTEIPSQTSMIHTPWNLWLYAKSLAVNYA